MTFGTGVAVPLPISRSWASASRDRGVVAAPSITQGIRDSNHSQACLVVSGADCLPHGRWQVNKKHCKKEVVVWADTVGKLLLEFGHEDAGLEAQHLHGEMEQLKIGLPFALCELPKQNFFQKIKRLI
jgi:hypothetical protein